MVWSVLRKVNVHVDNQQVRENGRQGIASPSRSYTSTTSIKFNLEPEHSILTASSLTINQIMIWITILYIIPVYLGPREELPGLIVYYVCYLLPDVFLFMLWWIELCGIALVTIDQDEHRLTTPFEHRCPESHRQKSNSEQELKLRQMVK